MVKSRGQIVGKNLPWKSIFSSVSIFFLFQAIVGTLVSAIFAQLPGILGYLSGTILVYFSFSVGVVIAALMGRRSMMDAARAMMLAYIVKVLVLGAVLLFVPLPLVIQNGWMLAGATVSVVVWLTVEMRSMLSLRILYFDRPE